MEIVEYSFFQNAVVAVFFMSILISLVGIFIVLRRMVFIVGGISHAAFGGIGLGFLLGINPLYIAIPFGIVAAFIVGYLAKKTRLTEDAGIGILWAFGMSLGILFISLSDKYVPDLMGYLFGSVMTITKQDLVLMGLITLGNIVIFILFYKEFLYISFDEDFAYTIGINTNFFYFFLLILVTVDVLVLIKISGVILVMALVTAPVIISRFFFRSMRNIMFSTGILIFFFSLVGIIASYKIDVSPSAIIVILFGIVVFLLRFLKR